MIILHFILGKANPNRANGVNQVVYGMAKYQTLAGHKVHVVGISKPMTVPYEVVDRNFFKVECFKTFNKESFDRLKTLARQSDIVHLHGVWNSMNIKVGRYLESISKPYVITAHCGYALDRLKQSNFWLKILYHYLWQKHLYEKAAGIHALTREESTDIARFCKNNNMFVVSNGVDSDTYDQYTYQLHNRKKIRFGYLGRISVEKNINNLIKAFALLPKEQLEQVELFLIGPLNAESKHLEKLVHLMDLENTIRFIGGKYGEDKIQTLLGLDVYIHPAYSDVVGIAVMEALALGLPTIVTRTSHMSYFNGTNAFIMVEPTSFDICRGIQEAINKRSSWDRYSACAKELYKNTFNWSSVVNKLIYNYKLILKQ